MSVGGSGAPGPARFAVSCTTSRMGIEPISLCHAGVEPDPPGSPGGGLVLTDDLENRRAVVVGLALTHTVDVTELVDGLGLDARQLPQRGVVEDHVGRHGAGSRQVQPQYPK